MLAVAEGQHANDPDAWNHQVFSSNGEGILTRELFVQFATAQVTGATDPDSGKPINTIWTRAYGAEEGVNIIPGPFYVFHPGDLLDLTMINLMSEENHKELEKFENAVNPSYDTDEIIMHIASEINVPHNPNNTNLHTHGLHVDPSRDDVDIVMAPVGDDSEYTHTGADKVSDQPVKRGSWRYVYRIPKDHLPGTHWYHAHKHGSTSIHVENGMAGLFAIKPSSAKRAIVPGLWTGSGLSKHDRPMMLQEIANYAGGSQGPGDSLQDKDTGGAAASDPANKPSKAASAGPDITINGVHQPTLTLEPGRVERWRIVNAGANHRTFSYLWLGRVLEKGKDGPTKVQEVPFYLVALDGVTLNKKEKMSAQRPVFLAPGNRADLLVQIKEPGQYAFYKNFPGGVTVVDGNNRPIVPITTGTIADPYGFAETNSGAANFGNLKVKWLDVNGKPANNGSLPVVPLLRVEKTSAGGQVLLDVAHDSDFPNGSWQPVVHGAGGGLIDEQLIVNVNVAGPVVNDVLPTDEHLSAISPNGSGSLLFKNQSGDPGIPAYVSPISPADIVQSRTAIFDMSGFTVNVFDKATKQQIQKVKQFSLNGRQFTVDDFIGSPAASRLIQEVPKLAALPGDSKIGVALNPAGAGKNAYKNTYWTNPGYYSKVVGDAASGYRYQPTTAKPTLQNLFGIPAVSQVNTAKKPLPGNIPGPPVAGTAEEWILINNSDIGHPFHIHISPFFVKEVGQLSYVNKQWGLDKINSGNKAKSRMGWVVDNWWDTILIPPHGYIKLQTWINVPQQRPLAEKDMKATTAAGQKYLNKALMNPSSVTVADNVNREGAWVFHCHILRHEDRGMMMTVKAQKNTLK